MKKRMVSAGLAAVCALLFPFAALAAPAGRAAAAAPARRTVSMGALHSAAVTETGDLYTWGSNLHGMLGTGNASDIPRQPAKVEIPGLPDANFVSVSLGYHHSAAITEDGDLYTWGSNLHGMLGLGLGFPAAGARVPTKVEAPGPQAVRFAAVSLGDTHSAAIAENGDLYVWWSNSHGQLGLGGTGGLQLKNYSRPVKVPGLSNVAAVSLGAYFSAAVTENGALYTWGANASGQLGLGYFTYGGGVDTPAKVPGLPEVTAVSLGGAHAAAVARNGDLYVWGANTEGQLGLGLGENATLAAPAKVKGLPEVAAVNLGSLHSAAFAENGDLYTWGRNTGGQLGLGDTENRFVPAKVTGFPLRPSAVPALSAGDPPFRAVSLGLFHSAAVTETGDLYTWGYNGSAQLGLPRKLAGDYVSAPQYVLPGIAAP